MKIYFSPFSPYVRKCLVSAHELGLDGRIELLPSAANPVTRDPVLIAKNPLGKVPTFIADDGRLLYDSRVICEYLDDLAGGSLFPRTGDARWDALTLQSLGDGMLDAALLARYEQVARPEAMRWSDWLNGQFDKIETSIAALEGMVAQLEGRVDIGTLTVGCAVWYLDLRFADLGWRNRYPAFAQWAAKFGQRASMKAAWSM
jgi:glutathione S-transferase